MTHEVAYPAAPTAEPQPRAEHRPAPPDLPAGPAADGSRTPAAILVAAHGGRHGDHRGGAERGRRRRARRRERRQHGRRRPDGTARLRRHRDGCTASSPAAQDGQRDGRRTASRTASGTASCSRRRPVAYPVGRRPPARPAAATPSSHGSCPRPARRERRTAPGTASGATPVAPDEPSYVAAGRPAQPAGGRTAPRSRAADALPRRPAGLRPSRRHRRGDPRPPGGDRRGGDRVGEDHAAAEDLPRRSGAGVHGDDRAHPAAADRRAQRRRADRRGARQPRSGRPSATRCGSPTARRSDSRVKVMTDGILLAELQHDRMLAAYDTIIIDEAHERSLNVDFLLGYLKRLLPRRPDLKVVITSATIDPERFAGTSPTRAATPAPIIEVSGRTYPVEVRYRPLLEESVDDRRGGRARPPGPDRGDRGCRHASWSADSPGDILVFLPGEREIRDTADVLKRQRRGGRSGFDIVPLYARLSSAEQHRVFERHTRRRVVLATNVAETSLTVPGIRYVVDTGARPDQPLLDPHQGAAAADRADQPGVRATSVRALRPRRGRHRDPALQRGGLRVAPGVHRAGDPAHLPGQRDPADDLARPRARSSGSRSSTRPTSARARRRPAAGGARRAGPTGRPARPPGSPASGASWRGCRSTPGWRGWSSRPTGSAACARCW